MACAIMPKPTAIAARLVSSTGSLAVVRRSTSGSSCRSSNHAHSSRTRTPPTMQPMVRVLPQPHSLALEMPRRKATSPTVSPTAPGTSRRPGLASWTWGTTRATRSEITAAQPAATQKSVCQSPTSTIQADRGSPIAPPTPSVALIAAIEVAAISGGVNSRMKAMPTGMKPMERPCIPRPTSIGARESEKAQISEPTIRIRELATSTRCLPTRSATRPAIGIATAAASSVAVITHAAFAADVERSEGSSDWIGIIIVWVSEALSPPRHRTVTASSGPRPADARGVGTTGTLQMVASGN